MGKLNNKNLTKLRISFVYSKKHPSRFLLMDFTTQWEKMSMHEVTHPPTLLCVQGQGNKKLIWVSLINFLQPKLHPCCWGGTLCAAAMPTSRTAAHGAALLPSHGPSISSRWAAWAAEATATPGLYSLSYLYPAWQTGLLHGFKFNKYNRRESTENTSPKLSC